MLPEGAPDNRCPMHLIVPFAGGPSQGLRAALEGLRLPHLTDCLTRWRAEPADRAAATSLTPPHERALGRVLGLQAEDGCWPLAAVEAAQRGLPGADQTWAWLSPAHWQLGTEQVSMADPAALGLDEAAARAFLASLQPSFAEEGIALHEAAPQRWLAAHPSLFEGVPCASVDRAAGRNVDPWLPADPRTRRLRGLQSEVQMLWHEHSLNQAREARGQLAVNSVWWSGCGRAGPVAWPASLVVDERLRGAALSEDGPAWGRALEALDETALGPLVAAAARGEPAALTLCGEQASVTLRPSGPDAGMGPVAVAGAGAARRAAAWWRAIGSSLRRARAGWQRQASLAAWLEQL